MIREIYIIFTIISIIIYEYLLYCLRLTNKDIFIFNILDKISKLDIFFIKLLQWIVNDTNNDHIKQLLSNFSNNVLYTKRDINYFELERLKNKGIIIENNPINSGTISIVFKGTYYNNPIIVKLKRNNIEDILNKSISLMKAVSFILNNSYYRNLKLDLFLETNMEYLFDQINFKREISNINLFYNNFKEDENIVIPYVYENLSNNDVIVMEYLNGNIIHDLIKKEYNKNILTYPNKFFIESIMKYNVIHSDLHQGNILFMNNSDTIGIIDFGLIKHTEKIEKKLLLLYLIGMHSPIEKFKNIILKSLVVKIDPNLNIHYDQNILHSSVEEFIRDRNKGCLQFIKINDILEKYNLKIKPLFFKTIFHIAPFVDYVKYLTKLNKNSVSLEALNKYKNNLIYSKLT